MLTKLWHAMTFGYGHALSVGGFSHDSGFAPDICRKGYRGDCHTLKTKEYENQLQVILARSDARTRIEKLLWWGICFSASYLVVMGVSVYILQDMTYGSILINTLVALDLRGWIHRKALHSYFRMDVRSMWRWHMLEHKTAFLMEQGIVPTRENIGTAQSSLLRCGSSREFIEFQITVAIWAMVHGWVWPFGVCWLISSCAAWATMNLSMLPGNQARAIKLFSFFAFPAGLAALAWERATALSEPTETQIDEAIRASDEFLATYPGILET